MSEEPDRNIEALLEDLEQQAGGLHLADRDAELVDRMRGEYARVDLLGRLLASLGHPVVVELVGRRRLAGELTEAGVDYLALSASRPTRHRWVVRQAAVETLAGLSDRAVAEAARPAVARLTFGSAVRRLAEAGPVLLHHLGGAQREVTVTRVGADFLEARAAPADTTAPGADALVLPFTALAAVRGS